MIRIINFQQYVPLTLTWMRNFSVIRFPLPDLGQKIKQGRVKRLYVKEGEQVMQFSKIADVQSDKQFTEITSPEEGIIKKLYYQEDQTCQVGDIFLDIQTTTDQNSHSKPKKIEQPKIQKSEQTQDHSIKNNDILASATVKMWARDHRIDLALVTGTGRKGRIFKEDIINYIERMKSKPIQGRIIPQQKKQLKTEVQQIKMSQVEKEWQKLTSYSATIPHLFFQQNFDVTSLKKIIEINLTKNKKISLLSVLIKTFSLALLSNPRINSIYKVNNQFSINVANQQNMLLPIYGKDGVSFFIIDSLQKCSINEIQEKLDSIGKGQTSPEKIRQLVRRATICLSHIGQANVLTMNPPILGETVAHVSIGQSRSLAISRQGKQQKRQIVSAVIGGDHRVLDGGSTARFMMAWKQLSENPTNAILNMI